MADVILPLINIDEISGEATRRRANIKSVVHDEDSRTFVETFVDNRLLVTNQDNGENYIEIAHEALLKSWKRLADWIDEMQEHLRRMREIERSVKAWKNNDRNDDFRRQGKQLEQYHNTIAALQPRLSPETIDYLYARDIDRMIQDNIPELVAGQSAESLLQWIDDINMSEPVRLMVGLGLSIGGDPRDGVGLQDGVPDITWLPVNGNAGKYDFKDKESFVYGVFDVPDFFIAKYQVTYTQYKEFARADYDNPLWWEGFPEKYQPQRLKEKITKAVNNPRDSISWYQSVAFARWLNHHLEGVALSHPCGKVFRIGDNAQIRLPTEWEWQLTAMNGDEEREYPWGKWRSGHANTGEADLGRVIAVGMYPHGAAKCGAQDMSGNLFEWCANNYHDPEIIDPADTDEKVLRGGAFYYDRHFSRPSYRHADYPYFEYSLYGVRLVVAPPIPGL